MLLVRDLQQTIGFYSNKLGFELVDTWPDDGPPVWCSLRSGGARVMFYTGDKPETSPELTGVLYFYPEDVAAIWEMVKDETKVEWPLQEMPYGMREFAIKDCNGYTLSFGETV
jgi:uncharacterized glyoxalase superfamily protein PhnB